MNTNAPGEATTVTQIVVGPFAENTYILHANGAKESLLIDPGDEAHVLEHAIERSGTTPVAIINTHGHIDHVGAIAALKERYGIPFYLHPDDVVTLEHAPMAAQLYGLPPITVPDVDHDLADGQRLELAGLSIDVMFTPGHAPGHVSFLVDGRCFGGDCLFNGSIGRTDLPGSDHAALMRTLRDRFLTLPDATIVHSGHGPDTTIAAERASNPFLTDL